MKNIPVVLIILLLGMPVFAQYDAVKTTMLPDDHNIANPKLNSFSGYKKKQTGFIHTNKQPDYKRFIELYNKKQHTDITTSRRLTFMDGPVVFSSAPILEINKNTNTLYQRYAAGITEPSAALQILGLVGGITAAAFASKNHHYSGLDYESPLGAYLQSTYHQDHRQ